MKLLKSICITNINLHNSQTMAEYMHRVHNVKWLCTIILWQALWQMCLLWGVYRLLSIIGFFSVLDWVFPWLINSTWDTAYSCFTTQHSRSSEVLVEMYTCTWPLSSNATSKKCTKCDYVKRDKEQANFGQFLQREHGFTKSYGAKMVLVPHYSQQGTLAYIKLIVWYKF